MPDRPNRGGRLLQRTADRGPDYPEPEWPYIPPDVPDGGTDSGSFASAQEGRLPNLFGYLDLATDPDGEPAELIVRTSEGEPTGPPDFENGVWISDFVAHLSPDLRRRLDNIERQAFDYAAAGEEIEYDESRENLGTISSPLFEYLKILRDRWCNMETYERSCSVGDAELVV